MPLSESDQQFLTDNHAAAMITYPQSDYAKAVRISVGLVDGQFWSVGTASRRRTKHVVDDPRCTVFVFDHQTPGNWRTFETRVEILTGPDIPEMCLRLFRIMQDRPSGPVILYGNQLQENELMGEMREIGALIYQFNVLRSYGL